MKKIPFYILMLVTLLLFVPEGCSVEKNTRLSRTYHNITAKFNVLFNGDESFDKGLAKIETGFRDDYAEILPIFNYVKKDAIALASSEMDRTINKCAKLISLHSITAKPKVKGNKNLTPKQREFFSKKEYNLFVDDAYLLMGKAHFYKQEYDQSSEIFRLILNDFKNQQVIYETQVWLARLFIETRQYKDASEILAQLVNNTSFPEKLSSALYTTYADYYLKQKDYVEAISYLEKALGVENQKKPQTRYTYILAQLFEKTGDLKRASDYYAQVIKMNPVYEMAFNARINRALAYEQGFGPAKDIENELNKMLHDDKNIEFQDQIYYALGNLAAKEGNNSKALENYTKSIKVNVGNEQQKARSYLTIANLYYAIPDYPHSQAYYDSALTNLQPDYLGYDALSLKSKSLTALVIEINAVKLGDSVMLLAQLPKEELYARIDAIIDDERTRDELERQKQQEEQLDQQFGTEIAIQNRLREQATADASKWYFYNDAVRSLGYSEFKLKWGNRRLEDHWQRSVKTTVSFASGTTEELESDTTEIASPLQTLSKFSRAFYLVNIPATDSAIMATNKRIELALYNMGLIYKNDLKDFDRANESFKELVKRFPASNYLLSSYYNLYNIAKDQNNQAMIDYYKNIIIGQFPESMYAKVLTNPNFARELEAEEQSITRYYEQTYELYKAENFPEVISRTDFAIKNYTGNPLIPQFTYLNILARGKTDDRKIFRENLTAVVAQYPNSEIAMDAQNIIDYLDIEHPEIKIVEETKLSQKLYQASPEIPHLFAFILNKNIDANQLVFNIINFNLDHFDNLNLRVEIMNLNATQNLILVKSFLNKQQVMEYLNNIRVSDAIFKDMPVVVMTPIAVSETNLQTLLEDKSVDRYLIFFNEYYQ